MREVKQPFGELLSIVWDTSQPLSCLLKLKVISAGVFFSFQTSHVQIKPKDTWQVEAQWAVATAYVEIWALQPGLTRRDSKSGQRLVSLGSNSSTLITRFLILKLDSSLCPRSGKDALLSLTTGDLGKGQQLFPVTHMPGSAPWRGWGAGRLQQLRSLRHQGLCYFPAQVTYPPDTLPQSWPSAHSTVHIPCDNSAGILPAGTGTDEQTDKDTRTSRSHMEFAVSQHKSFRGH